MVRALSLALACASAAGAAETPSVSPPPPGYQRIEGGSRVRGLAEPSGAGEEDEAEEERPGELMLDRKERSRPALPFNFGSGLARQEPGGSSIRTQTLDRGVQAKRSAASEDKRVKREEGLLTHFLSVDLMTAAGLVTVNEAVRLREVPYAQLELSNGALVTHCPGPQNAARTDPDAAAAAAAATTSAPSDAPKYGAGPEGSWWVVQDELGERAVRAWVSPLVLDLDGDGVRMSRKGRSLDVDGDFRADGVSEISATDGLLVLDLDRDGRWGASGRELLGTATDLDGDGRPDGYKDGFAALRALAAKAESRGLLPPGALSRGELGWAALVALEAAYGLRVKVGGSARPAVTLEDAGVVGLSLPTGACRTVKDFDGQGNDTMRCAGAVFQRADGGAGVYEDVFFAVPVADPRDLRDPLVICSRRPQADPASAANVPGNLLPFLPKLNPPAKAL